MTDTNMLEDATADGPIQVNTPDGAVLIDTLTVTTDPTTGADIVDVLSPDFDDPHIRVINPPRYVPDAHGTVEINGQPFRDDPLAALAHVIAQHGGRRKDARRGRP